MVSRRTFVATKDVSPEECVCWWIPGSFRMTLHGESAYVCGYKEVPPEERVCWWIPESFRMELNRRTFVATKDVPPEECVYWWIPGSFRMALFPRVKRRTSYV
jgi:hypothetical protein